MSVMKSHSATRVRPERCRVVHSVSWPMVADRLQPPPPPPSFTYGCPAGPIAVTLVLPYPSICPPDRNIRSTSPRMAASKNSSNRMLYAAPRFRLASLLVGGMNGGLGLIAYIAPSTSVMSGAWVRRATCMATWAHGLPNPWNTVSAGRMVRASATTNHSSIVQLMTTAPASSCEQLLPGGGGLRPGGQRGEPPGADRRPVVLLAPAQVHAQVFVQVIRPGLGRRHVLAEMSPVVAVPRIAGGRVRAVRHLGDRGHQVGRDRHPGRGHLAGGHQLIHGG